MLLPAFPISPPRLEPEDLPDPRPLAKEVDKPSVLCPSNPNGPSASISKSAHGIGVTEFSGSVVCVN